MFLRHKGTSLCLPHQIYFDLMHEYNETFPFTLYINQSYIGWMVDKSLVCVNFTFPSRFNYPLCERVQEWMFLLLEVNGINRDFTGIEQSCQWRECLNVSRAWALSSVIYYKIRLFYAFALGRIKRFRRTAIVHYIKSLCDISSNLLPMALHISNEMEWYNTI